MYFIKAELYSSLQCNKATAIIKIHFLDTYYSLKLSQKERINMEQNLSTYRIFYEVAKSGNISKAAEQLYISQPAISKTIVRLEDSLEIKLFKRNSRGVSLTDEGKVLFQYIKDAFAHIQEAEETLQKMKDFHIGHLDIGASSTLCRFILLPYLKAFMKEYPNIRISLKNQDSGKTLHLLEDHQIDLALAALPKKLGNNQEILLKNIRGEAFSLFQDANVMLLEEQNLSRHHIENYLKENQIYCPQIMELNTMDLLIDSAKIGIGIAWVIRDFVAEDLKNGQLVEIKLPQPIQKRRIAFLYNNKNNSPSLESFVAFLKKETV